MLKLLPFFKLFQTNSEDHGQSKHSKQSPYPKNDYSEKTYNGIPDENDEIFKNPDIYLTPAELIRKAGYPCEFHTVISKDGYIISLFRIPFGKNHKEVTPEVTRPAVLMAHGILMSGAGWILNSEKNVLAYQLVNRGFDCWLLNARGCEYSRTHSEFKTNSREYWDFSWHEMAQYDIAVVIDYILQTSKNESLYYVGLSMGCAILFAATSIQPELERKIKLMIALAPGVYIGHAKTVLMKAARIPALETILSSINYGQFPIYSVLKMVKDFYPWSRTPERHATWVGCHLKDVLCGAHPEQINWPVAPILVNHGISGASVRTHLHFAQSYTTGDFREYDFGHAKNMKKYGQAHPPSYDLSKCIFPVCIYYGDNDACVQPEDAQKLASKLPNVITCQRVDLPKWSHTDFTFAKDLDKFLNDHIIQVITSHDPSLLHLED